MPLRSVLALPLFALALCAQDELSLRQFFEGKRVRVKMDMPATHEGVDYHYRENPAIDFKSYSDRIRKCGISLRAGDEVMITGIRLKPKNIELQLGGGGYGKFGDDTGYVSTPTVPKSNREKDLEREVANEKDKDRRERLQRELNRVRDDRLREERYQRDEAARQSAIKKAEIDQKRLQAGSRFNLWFPANYLKESVPTPTDVMAMLNEWVDFGGLR